MERKIPRCMSTQHPDNVVIPFFARNTQLSGDDEIEEAYYTFSHLGCDEQMWDCEGKEVDNFVVKKLLTKYENFFREKQIGKDVYITLRVPNPTIERAEAKILLETLDSIPRYFDAANLFYGNEIPPIFEVILPMADSHVAIDRIYKYYKNFIIKRQFEKIDENDITIAEWIGKFFPEEINVIPLFEDKESMLNAHNILREYLKDKNLTYQRVFLARSDPAMNYGMLSAVLLNKIALKNLEELSYETGVKIHPILGVGSAPLRGNLKPNTVERTLSEFPSVATFTIQSAFKYDNPPEEVKEAIEKIKRTKPKEADELEPDIALSIFEKYAKEYQKQVLELAPIINEIARFVPKRRRRKLHIGLFGYSRNVGKVTLPRAITFTAALYSIGVPPEILGLNALEKKDLFYIKCMYRNFERDIREALMFSNVDSKFFPKELKKTIQKLFPDFEVDKEHREITNKITKYLDEHIYGDMQNLVLRAASLRKFLG